jgi:UDP-glucose 4-epimerase
MVMNFVIGSRSNLSRKLCESLDGSILVSSFDFIEDFCRIGKIDSKINLIFNNFHKSSGLQDTENFSSYIENAILNTAKILDFLHTEGVTISKILYSSSSSVYGNNKFCSESDSLYPRSLQASLKLANEELIKRFCVAHDVDYTIARVFNMYGGDDSFSIISKIKEAVILNKSLIVANNGSGVRDYIHINDVVSSYKALLSSSSSIPIVNIAQGKGHRLADILALLQKKGYNLELKYLERDEILASIADVSLLNRFIDTKYFMDVSEYLLDELSAF